MPIGPTRTKAQKQKVVHQEMHKFKAGSLHSGSKQGPVVTNPKQAIAISLSESGQAKGKLDGKDTKFHSVRHSPGGPANNDGYVPSSPHKEGAGHSKQAKPHAIGAGYAEKRHTPNQSYAAEQREHWGNKAEGSHMAKREVGYVGSGKRGSELQHEEPSGHERQPHGNATGEHHGNAEHHRGHFSGQAHSFRQPATSGAHGFKHEGSLKQGALRLSGHSGAHQLGRKKK